jgi:hypothetical protein
MKSFFPGGKIGNRDTITDLTCPFLGFERGFSDISPPLLGVREGIFRSFWVYEAGFGLMGVVLDFRE